MLRPLVCSQVLCRMTEMDLFRSSTRLLHCLTSTNYVLKVLSFLQCPLLTFCSNECPQEGECVMSGSSVAPLTMHLSLGQYQAIFIIRAPHSTT